MAKKPEKKPVKGSKFGWNDGDVTITQPTKAQADKARRDFARMQAAERAQRK